MDHTQNWERFKEYLFADEDLGLQLDISRTRFPKEYLTEAEPMMQKAYAEMRNLENGAIANPDENRMVGHYWLRNPDLAPDPVISEEIKETVTAVKRFVHQIHAGELRGEKGRIYKNALLIGIGGSSLGPRFVSEALGSKEDKLRLFFIDNTDPDGLDRVLSLLNEELDRTLAIVISKSGGTIETRNGMEEVRRFYIEHDLNFPRHAVGITQAGSLLDQIRKKERWLTAFPMWDWVGGRTSVLSAVGLLPLALQGVEIDLLLEGSRKCDELTRKEDTRNNPSALLALMWYTATGGKGGKQMVMLPYKDRLELLTKYLQQLIMESLGKETDLDGKMVKQGIAVLGNKGSADQHSYLQQLLEGPDNIFVTFIEVLKDRIRPSITIAEESTSGDYLHAFLLGTRNALSLKGRDTLTITIRQIDAFSVGVLLALFERTVGLYAFMTNINAYHQPAVELGKKGAGEIIAIKNQAIRYLEDNKGKPCTIEEIAIGIDEKNMEALFKTIQHLAANPDHGVLVDKRPSGAENKVFQYLYRKE